MNLLCINRENTQELQIVQYNPRVAQLLLRGIAK